MLRPTHPLLFHAHPPQSCDTLRVTTDGGGKLASGIDEEGSVPISIWGSHHSLGFLFESYTTPSAIQNALRQKGPDLSWNCEILLLDARSEGTASKGDQDDVDR